MKKLIVLRHARSSWEHPRLSDIHRPLCDKGVRDAMLVGAELKRLGIIPDQILVSPAVRTQSTATLIADQIGCPLDNLTTENTIYNSSEHDILQLIRNVSPSVNTLMVVGHNPTFTHLVNRLDSDRIDNLPTCGCAGFLNKADVWDDFGKQKEEKLFFIRPKNLR